MKTKFSIISLASMLAVTTASAADSTSAPKENIFAAKPLGISLSIKMAGPYVEPADLQIICLFKHRAAGDTYEGAAKDTDAHLGGLLSGLALGVPLLPKMTTGKASYRARQRVTFTAAALILSLVGYALSKAARG